MSKQNNIEGKYSTIVPIEGEDDAIRFKLNSHDDFNSNTLADVVAYSEKMRNVYLSKQQNDIVKSLMKGDLNYSSHGTMTSHCPDSTTFNINDLSLDDKIELIGETYSKDPMEEFLDSLKF